MERTRRAFAPPSPPSTLEGPPQMAGSDTHPHRRLSMVLLRQGERGEEADMKRRRIQSPSERGGGLQQHWAERERYLTDRHPGFP